LNRIEDLFPLILSPPFPTSPSIIHNFNVFDLLIIHNHHQSLMSRYDPIRDEFIAATSGGLNPNIPALSQGDRLDALLDRQKAFDDDDCADREGRRGPPRYGDVFEDDYDNDVYDEGLSPRGMLSPQDMFSPQGMMSPQGVMSPQGMRHGEPMGDIARTRAAMEDPLVSSARDGYEREAREEYERDLDEQMFANMDMGMGREQ
jgi:hypothetical protein